jgi:hypothetical protein
VEELARVLLLVLVIAVVLNLVQGGRARAADWFRAKFLGKSAAAA